MRLPHRRQFLDLVAGAAALPAVSRIAAAQTFPTRPITMTVGFAATGASLLAALPGRGRTVIRSTSVPSDHRCSTAPMMS
jgi:hypothetical protein